MLDLNGKELNKLIKKNNSLSINNKKNILLMLINAI